jgi:SAM-dependent methyltransferase
VLDVGSGAGGVALLAADLVGPSGSVVGVEIDQASVAAARTRAAQAGITNVTFVVGDVSTMDLPGPFDAAVGRLILMHLSDPVATLSRVRALLHPGAVVAFLEGIMATAWLSRPPSPTLEELQPVRLGAVGRVRANLQMGLDMRSTFLHAGLGDPHLSAEVLIGGGPGWPGFAYIEGTVRSLIESWKRAGVPGADGLVVDGLAERIEREIGHEGTVMLQPFIGAWTASDGREVG